MNDLELAQSQAMRYWHDGRMLRKSLSEGGEAHGVLARLQDGVISRFQAAYLFWKMSQGDYSGALGPYKPLVGDDFVKPSAVRDESASPS